MYFLKLEIFFTLNMRPLSIDGPPAGGTKAFPPALETRRFTAMRIIVRKSLTPNFSLQHRHESVNLEKKKVVVVS